MDKITFCDTQVNEAHLHINKKNNNYIQHCITVAHCSFITN